ncbi:MAG: NADH-quinone oxidoreductase subunit NuoF [Candidatus Tectomicrobia bacterium]|uniref:NADH-quinone oxidoreductase subunit F n=1 Tax=Tectimicrobiota bacterium TaxID=2528274 RepID=A0A932M127_UNCTE|nr:NADH-quinone oxidoreductase subunit NuoF [Candidatus Tectomicrobia bacterium]
MAERIVFKNVEAPNSRELETYRARGGYRALEKALKEIKPDDLIDIVKRSGLRGRGGAGFPAGLKWSFVPKESKLPKYLCCNADESEPGTFKDRVIIEKDPHLLLEGITLTCYAIGIHTAYIYIRGEMVFGARVLEQAIAEAQRAGFLGNNILGSDFHLEIYVHRGAGAYICGEETALMESLEGKRGEPRVKPPFPATRGLFGGPTVINNVETLANIPDIVLKGPEWFAAIGTEKSTGTRVFCVSGHVNRPGTYELPMGVTARDLIYEHAGGIRGGRPLKAFIPGGSSVPFLTAEHLDVKLDFESVAQAGSLLGSAGFIVMDDTTCMVWAALNLCHFYEHESCGQCTPCREGTRWMSVVLERIEHGRGRQQDLDLLLDVCSNIRGQTLCPFGDAALTPVESTVKLFRSEYESHIQGKGCPFAP